MVHPPQGETSRSSESVRSHMVLQPYPELDTREEDKDPAPRVAVQQLAAMPPNANMKKAVPRHYKCSQALN